MKVEIKGVEFCNKGAELMLYAIIRALTSHVQGCEIVLAPGYLLPYERRAKLGAWQKFSFRFLGIDWTWLGNVLPSPVRQQLRHFGIVAERDIDVVLDASGFAYGDKWGANNFKQTLKQLKRIKKRKVPYIFLPQAFGPFKSEIKNKLMRNIVSHSTFVIARDPVSLAHLKALKARQGDNKITLFPDFTPLVDSRYIEVPISLPDNLVSIIPNYKVFSHQDEQRYDKYIQFLVDTITCIRSFGLTPILLNHEGERDHQICLDVSAMLQEKPLILSELNALEVKKVIASSLFCVSSRFHGCVSSLSQGIPALATSWNHKYEELFDYYECSDFIIDIDTSISTTYDLVAHLIEERETIAEGLRVRAKAHRASVEMMWTEVLEHVKR